MKIIRNLLYGLTAVLVVCACNFNTLPIIVTATPSPTVPVTATHTQTVTPTVSPTIAVTTRPIATLVTVPNCTVRTDWQLYTIVAGDTLGSIARRTNTTVANLTSANCLANANTIFAGQRLRVPSLPVVTTQPTAQNPDPRPIVYTSDGLPPSDNCVVLVASNRTPQTTPLYRTTNVSEGNFAFMGNWGFWISTVNGFHQITIASSGTIINAFVRETDTVLSPANCNQQSPVYINQGNIQVSPHLASGISIGSNLDFDVQADQIVTLTWANAPGGLADASFYLIVSNGDRVLLGKDINGSDGWSVQWRPPLGLRGHYVLAEGNGFNAAPFDIAVSFLTTLFSNVEPTVVCVAQNLAPLTIYMQPSVQSEIMGELPANTQWLVTEFATDGWIALRGGGRYISGSLNVIYSGTCPNERMN